MSCFGTRGKKALPILTPPTRPGGGPINGDGLREVHCNTCEGAGAALRTYLRVFRGVHKQYLHRYVATYEAMVNMKRVTPHLIQRRCIGNLSVHTDYARAEN